MTPIITPTQYYLQSQINSVEIPILKDMVPYLSRSPSINGKTLAKVLEVKRGQLSGTLQLLTGATLNDLLKQWKLLHAMNLLRNTRKSYQEVAEECGYKTINGLSKFMERMIKCTAYEYRAGRRHGNRRA